MGEGSLRRGVIWTIGKFMLDVGYEEAGRGTTCYGIYLSIYQLCSVCLLMASQLVNRLRGNK